jgi:pimeloyl-ACP methyl ester carboxylesterase
MTTGPMPSGPADLQIDVDFISQQLVLATSDGHRAFIDLIPRSVAEFHSAVTTQLRALGFDVTYSTPPSELPDPVPFEQDTADRAYGGAAARRWWLAMLSVGRVMDRFRTPFGGKSSPVLFYWGGFDLTTPASAAGLRLCGPLYAYLSPALAGWDQSALELPWIPKREAS